MPGGATMPGGGTVAEVIPTPTSQTGLPLELAAAAQCAMQDGATVLKANENRAPGGGPGRGLAWSELPRIACAFCTVSVAAFSAMTRTFSLSYAAVDFTDAEVLWSGTGLTAAFALRAAMMFAISLRNFSPASFAASASVSAAPGGGGGGCSCSGGGGGGG